MESFHYREDRARTSTRPETGYDLRGEDLSASRCRNHFEFDAELKILVLLTEGVVDDAEVMTANQAIAAQVTRLHPLAGISDLSRVTKFDVSGDAMRTAARQPSPYPDSIPRFIVAPQEYVFAVARRYELVGYRSRSNLTMVRSMQEAVAALAVRDRPQVRTG